MTARTAPAPTPTFLAYVPPRDAGTVNGWTVKEHPSARAPYRFQAVYETPKGQRIVRSAPTMSGLGIATAAAARARINRAMAAALALAKEAGR